MIILKCCGNESGESGKEEWWTKVFGKVVKKKRDAYNKKLKRSIVPEQTKITRKKYYIECKNE